MTFTTPNFRRSKRNLFLLFWLFFTCSLPAQTTVLLSLEEAIQLAEKHNLQLKVDTALVEMLNSKIVQVDNLRKPQVGLNLNYTRISNNVTPFSVAFPTGEVTLNPQILNQSYNSLQLKQLIWNGKKIAYGLEASKKELAAASYDLQKNKITNAYNVTALWYNLYVLKTSKKIIEANIKVLNGNKQDLVNFVNQGIAIDNDALKIDLAITNLESNLSNISNSISALNFNLCIYTGLPTNTTFELPELQENDVVVNANLDTYIAEALSNRLELKSIKVSSEAAEVGLKLAKSNYLPTISAIASANYNLPEQRVFPNQPKFKPTWFVGVNLNWSLSELYTNKAKVLESQKSIEKVQSSYNLASEGIIIEVNMAYTEYLQAAQTIVNAKKEVELATENFRVEQNRLTASTTTPINFLDANSKLLQAQLNLNSANANTQLAFKKLNKTLGK
ncbi:TolC family protein [Haliscomenobacter sp.]|uniref:TolC family protein n=1 Tax=Haliscomenobacter sp. TaxID=2717303 RepID=UPI0033651557